MNLMAPRATDRLTRAALLAATAVPVVVAAVVLACFGAYVLVTVEIRGGLVVAVLLSPVVVAGWRVLAPRRDRAIAAPVPAPQRVPAPDAVAALVRAEAAARGLAAPATVWLTTDRDVVLHPDGLGVGAFAAAEGTAAELRAAIAAALLSGADTTARRLRDRRRRLVTRALTAAEEHPLASAPWRWFARAADRLCARALAARDGLVEAATPGRASDRSAPFERYWNAYVMPCLEAGYRPPLLQGWRRWLETPEDAVPVLAGDDALEAALLAARGAGRAEELVPLDWDRFAEAVLVPQARDIAGAAELRGATVADLPELARAAVGSPWPDDRLFALGSALLVALADAGWDIVANLGAPVQAVGETAALLPFDVAFCLVADEDVEDWTEFAETEGITALSLDPASPLAGQALELETLLAAPAAVPAGAHVELALTGPQAHRARTIAVAVTAAVFGAPLAALMGLTGVTDAGLPWGARVFMLAMAVALAAGLGLWTRSRIRLANARGVLRLDGEQLVIELPALLRRPFVLPRALVRTVVLDTGPERRDELARRVTLPIAPAPWEGADAYGWLWTAGVGSIVPLLAVEPCLPNVALVFEHPIPAPDVRRERANGPLRGEGIQGLLLAADPDPGAHAALARLGLGTELGVDDAQRLVGAFTG